MKSVVNWGIRKSYQSPTTPVTHLSYMVDIVSINFGEEGVFDTDDEDLKQLILLLEKLNLKKLYPNGIG
jgi:hypothetical protein